MKKLSFLFILLFLFSFCKKENKSANTTNTKSVSAVAIFVIGDATSAGVKLKVGSKIKENEEIIVGKKSTIDIQILETESPITIRIKENSKFSIKATEENGETKYKAEISSGEGFFNVAKQKSKKEGFDVVTPTSIAGVRGTKFSVSIDSEGKSNTTVIEGMVANKVRIPELEGVSKDDIEKNPNLKKLVSQLDSKEMVLSEGQKSEVALTDKKKVLEELGITDTIKIANPSELASELNKKLEGKEIDKIASAPKVEEISQEESNSISTVFNEINPIEPSKLKDNFENAMKEREDENIKIRKKRFDKESSRMKLKNGKIVKGIIIQENGVYRVLNEEGEETFQESEIKEMLFD